MTKIYFAGSLDYLSRQSTGPRGLVQPLPSKVVSNNIDILRNLCYYYGMSERHKNSPEKSNAPKRPNYKLRRFGAVGLASVATAIAVTGNTSETVRIPVDVTQGAIGLVKKANEPKGREIPNHTAKIENANGIQGGVYYEQHGNSDSHLGSGPEG